MAPAICCRKTRMVSSLSVPLPEQVNTARLAACSGGRRPEMALALTVEVVRQVAAVTVLQNKTQVSCSLERLSNQYLSICVKVDQSA